MLKQTKKAVWKSNRGQTTRTECEWYLMPRPIWQQMLVSLTIWSILEPEISWKMPALRVQTTIVLSLVCITGSQRDRKKIRLQGFRITALFNNTRTLKLKAQPSYAFFAAVNQVFGGSSQLTTTAELCSLSELCTTIWSPRARQQSKAGRSRRTFDWR